MKEIIKRYLGRFLSIEQKQVFKKFLFWRKKINFDAGLHWCINNENCNLACIYCPYPHTKNKAPRIDSSALIKVIEKANKIFKVSLCGNGEPFLVPNLIEACAGITKKHYISLVTNLTSKKVEEFCAKINPKKVLNIIASLHIKELEKLDLMDRYIHNFLLCRKKGFDVWAQEVAYPPLLDEVEKYKTFFKKNSIKIHFDEYQGEYGGRAYPDAYTDDERKRFGLISKRDSQRKRYQGEKLCNAGYNTCFVVGANVYPCFQIKEAIGNIYKEIKFKERMIKCPHKICLCPINMLDYSLYNKARKEMNVDKDD